MWQSHCTFFEISAFLLTAEIRTAFWQLAKIRTVFLKMEKTISKNFKDLLEASKNGQIEVVKQLIKTTGANARDNNNITPLHYASQYGHYNVVKLLIQNGAKIDEQQVNNWWVVWTFCSQSKVIKALSLHLKKNSIKFWNFT